MSAGELTFEIHPDEPQDTGSVAFTHGESELTFNNFYRADSFTLGKRPVMVGFSVLDYSLSVTALATQAKGLLFDSLFSWQQEKFNEILTNGAWVVDADASSSATSLVIDNGEGADVTTLPVIGNTFSVVGSTTIHTISSVTANTPTTDETTIGFSPGLSIDVSDGDPLSLACRARIRFTDEVNRTTAHPSPHPKALVTTNTLASGYEWGYPICDALLQLEGRDPRGDSQEIISFTVTEASFS